MGAAGVGRLVSPDRLADPSVYDQFARAFADRTTVARAARQQARRARTLIARALMAPRRVLARVRGAGRPARRTVKASARGPDDSDPPPRPKRRATYSYACSPCPHCGAELRIYPDGLYCANPSCLWGRS